MTEPVVRVLVLLGSARSESNTAKATAVLLHELAALGATSDLVDPRTIDLRVPGTAGSQAAVTAAMADLQGRAKAAHGVVLVTPEYDGSYSAVMKLLIEHLGYPSVLAGKPVAILGTAAGQIGAARAIDHLRAVCVHIGALVVPGATSVGSVHKGFDAAGNIIDKGMEERIRVVARSLVGFVRRLGP